MQDAGVVVEIIKHPTHSRSLQGLLCPQRPISLRIGTQPPRQSNLRRTTSHRLALDVLPLAHLAPKENRAFFVAACRGKTPTPPLLVACLHPTRRTRTLRTSSHSFIGRVSSSDSKIGPRPELLTSRLLPSTRGPVERAILQAHDPVATSAHVPLPPRAPAQAPLRYRAYFLSKKVQLGFNTLRLGRVLLAAPHVLQPPSVRVSLAAGAVRTTSFG